MSNLKSLDEQIDQVINFNALPGGIKALAHNGFLHALIKALGKYTGSSFIAKTSGQAPQGTLLWNGNAMNNTSPFIITVSKNTADGNNIGLLLTTANSGDIIRFKDFEGRSVLLTFLGFSASTDGSQNDTFDISVQGSVDNVDYTYSGDDEYDCVIELITSGSPGSNFFTTTKPLIWKKPDNPTPNVLEIGDWVKIFITPTLIIEGVYSGLGVDPNDLTDIDNFIVFEETDLTA